MSVLFEVKSYTALDGQTMRYAIMSHPETADSETPIVFMPGLGGSIKHALGFFEQLVPSVGPVYSLDARGVGLNKDVPPKVNPGSYIKDFQEFVAVLQQQGALAPEASPALFGLSLGAVLAVLYLNQAKHPFKSLTLVAPAFKPHPKCFSNGFKLQSYWSFLLKWHTSQTILPYGIQHITKNHVYREDEHLSQPFVFPTFYLVLVDLLCQKAFSQSKRLQVPTSIVIPELDSVCDPEVMNQAYHRIPHPQKAVWRYPHLLHDVCMEPKEDSEVVTKDIITWLGQLHQNASESPTPINV